MDFSLFSKELACTIHRHFVKFVKITSLKKSKYMPHLQKELELNHLEAPNKMETKTVTQQATRANPEKQNDMSLLQNAWPLQNSVLSTQEKERSK